MNIYDDYISYLDESMEILDALRISKSPILVVINDVLKVTDYVYKLYSTNSKIDEDLEEVFSLGFGYLSNVISDIKTYYEDCFDKNIDELNKCSSLIINMIMLDDFKSFLDVNDYLTDETKEKIETLMERVDRLIANKKSSQTDILEEVEILIDENTPRNATFNPVYTVFALMVEELSLINDIDL